MVIELVTTINKLIIQFRGRGGSNPLNITGKNYVKTTTNLFIFHFFHFTIVMLNFWGV